MNDRIVNQINRRRSQIVCADRPEHQLIWQGQAPARFESKLDECRGLLAELESTAGSQVSDRTGVAKDKDREEIELEDAAYNVAGLLVAYAREAGNESLATKHDKSITHWRRMRDATLLVAARELQTDLETTVAGPDATLAADYGLDAAAVTALTQKADDYDAWLVAPRDSIVERKHLTASLPEQVRNLSLQFDTLEQIARVFRGTAAGRSFYDQFIDAGQVIDGGHGPGTGGGGNGGGGGGGGNSETSEPAASNSSEPPMPQSSSYLSSSSSYAPGSSSYHSSYSYLSSSYYQSSSSSTV